MTKVFFPFPSHVFVQQQKQRLFLKSSVRLQSRVFPTTKAEAIMTKVFFPSPSQMFVKLKKQRPSLKSSFPFPSQLFFQQQKKSPCPKSSKSFSTVKSLSSKNRRTRFPHKCRKMSWIEEKWRENPRPEWNFLLIVKFPDRRRIISCASLSFLRRKKCSFQEKFLEEGSSSCPTCPTTFYIYVSFAFQHLAHSISGS